MKISSGSKHGQYVIIFKVGSNFNLAWILLYGHLSSLCENNKVPNADIIFWFEFVQKQFSELLMKAASDYGALTASVADFQWTQNFKEPPSVWGVCLWKHLISSYGKYKLHIATSWIIHFSFLDLALKTSYPVQMSVADFRCYTNVFFLIELAFLHY